MSFIELFCRPSKKNPTLSTMSTIVLTSHVVGTGVVHLKLEQAPAATANVGQTTAEKKAEQALRETAWIAFRAENLWSNSRDKDIFYWNNTCGGRVKSEAQKHGGWTPVAGTLLKAEKALLKDIWNTFKKRFHYTDRNRIWHTKPYDTSYSNYQIYGWSPNGSTLVYDP